ncbi:MAG: hypothetical protein A2Y20_04120 [Firmicutes bacterium GWF2_51_9]|nr:MAG: hypothetical protein A2Y20_04120 [Firmicutes bacterium GWF2_51_9]OGS59615.1 MAG: hypothetical protein A2Y19_01700 [Firmicutes bacterium GWE2_51_13]
MHKLHIYHTNDIHSHFDRFSSLCSYLKQVRGENDLVFDAGDFNDFRSVMISGTMGRAGKVLLKEAGYDALCIGNNEGFSGIECLEEMAADDLPLLSMNLTKLDGSPIRNVKKSIILERGGIRFLVIGVSPYFGIEGEGKYNVFFNMDGLHSHNPIPLIRDELERNSGLYDFSILLSHQGISTDERCAREIERLDIIIGGHSHTLLDEALVVNQTIIHHAGEYGKVIGKLSLEIDDGKIVGFNGEVIENTFEEDAGINKLIDEQTRIAHDKLNETLVEIEKLDFHISEENDLINFICDALMKEVKCDFSFINHGIVNHGLAGKISRRTLLEVSPSPLNPTLIKITGRQFIDAIRLSFDGNHVLKNGRGPGFRGTHIGGLGVSANVRITKEPFGIWIDEKRIAPECVYTVMSDDYLQRGSGYPMLMCPDNESRFFPGFIRDLLQRNLLDESLRNGAKTRRIK